MKLHALLFTLISLMIPASLTAQVQSRTATTTLGGWTGTMTYGYRLEDGKEILEGRKSFSARSGEDTYALEAQFKDGLLDGAASARLHRSFMASGRDTGILQVWKASLDITLTARFSQGRLSGLLTCNYIPSGSPKAGLSDMAKQSFSANYEMDRVVGSYSYLSYGYPQRVVVNGSTDADGLAEGKWQVYYPQVEELMTEEFRQGARMSDLSSAVRNCLEGRLTPQALFDDYGYLASEEELSFGAAADYFSYILTDWLKDYAKVIPYDFGPGIHKVRTIRYTVPTTFSKAGFETFKERYFASLCGGEALGGVTLLSEEDSHLVAIAPEAASIWKPQLRNAEGLSVLRVSLSPWQWEALQDEEAIDAVRRRFARSGDVLLDGDSPYKAMLLAGKLPSEWLASSKGAESIGRSAFEIKEYLESVKRSFAALKLTPDGKFYVRDGIYYGNPGWDLNLMIADAERLGSTCREASRLYDAGMAYAGRRPDVAASFRALCGKIETGSFNEMVGTMDDARYFLDKVVTPDILGKVGSQDEMRQNLSDKCYSHLIAVYPAAPAANFRNASGVDAFVSESLAYAGFQRNLLAFDRLVRDIRSEKDLLDADLAEKPYKSMTGAVNGRLATYSLHPSFTNSADFASEQASLEECLAFIKDVRDYIAVHKEYIAETDGLRDLLSRSRTNHISKFYRNLTKDFSLNWEVSLPMGKCSSDVREAIGVTRRIRSVVSAPDAARRDKAIKGLSDTEQIWNLLEER